ncbi:hypothetical protein GGR21_002252 [Dysgonomonas hofstadii]|uniref:Uncharacterized protein n=1 Tax=Dysgonomonas hofstadii TaxID=637886 RepID=A0A840CK55_9BACT|nr:hypothetical protein [Dysgonomonas hofstadii]
MKNEEWKMCKDCQVLVIQCTSEKYTSLLERILKNKTSRLVNLKTNKLKYASTLSTFYNFNY